jgi:bla regulator protein blaR1
MKPDFTLFSDNLDYALGWMVIHSLWQATLIAFISGILMVILRKKTAKLRYIVGNIALLAVVISAVVTFCVYYDFATEPAKVTFTPTLQALNTEGVNAITQNTTIAEKASNPLSISGFKDYFNQNIPLIVTIWILGVAIFMLKLFGGISYIYYLKNRMNFPADEYWTDMLQKLADKAGLQRSIDIVESAMVRTPMVVGHLKPLILFPMGIINRLTPEEVEAILAHELAHIMRKDFIFNILQSIVEALFYFHPAVWWLSSQIRNERESACDDIAIELINSKVNYARALVAIQEMAYFRGATQKSIDDAYAAHIKSTK